MSTLELLGKDPGWLTAVKGLLVFVICVLATLISIVMERKIVSWMQMRIGPNRTGPFGSLQSLADGVKLALKEDIIPTAADRIVFVIAPVISVTACFMSFAVIPMTGVVNLFGHKTLLQLTDLPVGVLYILAVASFGVYGIVLAGWSSGSIAAQHNWWFGVTLFPSFVIYAISMVGETNRAPFDLAEAEGELVGGFHTEYSSLKFALFFLAEYVNIIGVSALATTLFLGGYHALPGLGFTENWLGGWFTLIWFFAKVSLFFYIFVWLRGTLPRMRYDQFMKFGWKVLIPVSLIWIMIVSTLRLMSQNGASRIVVGSFGVGVVLVILTAMQFMESAKKKRIVEDSLGEVATPSFPVPELPTKRAEQLNG